MWKQQEATNLLIRFIIGLLLTTHLLDNARALSDKRLCADKNCKEIISMGIGVINYQPGEKGMVAFKMNSNIRIKSKSAGKDPSLWGIEVNGREGYAPKRFIRESKMLIPEKDLKFIVDVNQMLSASEKQFGQDNTVEANPTAPLNLTPAESTENTLKKSSNEKLAAESLLVATPVLSQIVDGTEIPNDVNEVDVNTQNEKNNAHLLNKLEKKPIPSNQDGEIDGIYRELKVSEGVEKDKEENKPDNKDVLAQSSREAGANTASLNDVIQINSVENTQLDTMAKPETKKMAVEITKQITDNYHETKNSSNIDIVDKKDQSKIAENKTATKDMEALPENSGQESVTEQVTNADSVDSTNSSSDVKTEDSKVTENHEKTAKQETQISEEESKFSTFNEIVNIKDDDKNDREYSVQNVNTTETEIIKENDANNVTVKSNDKNEDDEEPLNSGTLGLITLETQAEINLENEEKSTNNSSIKKQDEAQNAKFNDEDLPVQKSETDNIVNSLPEKINDIFSNEINLVQEKATKESATLANENEVFETTSENPAQTQYNPENIPKTLAVVLKKEGIVEENDFPQKEGSSENKVDEYTTINNNVSESDKRNNTVNNIEESDEVIANDSKEKTNNEFQSKQSEIDHEIDNTDSFPKETVEVSDTIPNRGENEKTSNDYVPNIEDDFLNTTPSLPEQKEINPTTFDRNDDILSATTQSTTNDYSYEEVTKSNSLPNDIYGQQTEDFQETIESFEKQTTESYNTNPTISSDSVSQPGQTNSVPKALPSSTPNHDFEAKENKGLFATIMGTVNTVLSMNKKNKQNELEANSELDRILFSKKNNNNEQKHEKLKQENSLQYCATIGPGGDCPEIEQYREPSVSHFHQMSTTPDTDAGLTYDIFLKSVASKILEMSQLLAFLVIVAAATLFFVFGYYCFCNTSREGVLLSKLNQLESSFLASHKENAILKHNLMSTRQKLASIEDNSFGSNDMVVSLKKELEDELMEKARLQEQISVLQKELENAADAGIELNKIVSELLSNQSGDESIISSVEELQQQLNEQQITIFEINASLAEKSRENSELQLMIAEQHARYETELASVQRDNDELEHEKGNLITKLDVMKNDFDKNITAALEGKNMEIKRLQNEIVDLTNKWENEHTKWQTSVAKIEALEECLKNIRKDPNLDITEVIDVAYVKAQLIEIQKKYNSLKEKHETELYGRKLAENQMEILSAEVEKFKQDFNKSEKDKLEAQTRLEVLSNYFKDKENQLQKELSLKEAMWLKQQGETTTTVDRLTAMQDEIQSLKSQNDSLRAEIEAQVAAHKAQTGTLENRAHETWLAARQSDRRYEEARAEATALRRKLTALAGGNVIDVNNKPSTASTVLGDDLTQAPSPIHMESPGSPMLGRMPPPPFLPRPFMGHPPPFMGMPPPPPFVPPGEMRPAPLGRIMSPPPPQRAGRFSPQPLDYEDYLDYDSNNTWHHHTYSPPPRTYRSLSPTDSRYDYGTERDLISTYDTETDFSPPPSPRESRRRVDNSSDRIDSNAKISYGNGKKFNTSNKGLLSSGSEKSFNTPVQNETKTRKGNAVGGGKSLV